MINFYYLFVCIKIERVDSSSTRPDLEFIQRKKHSVKAYQ